MPRPQRFDLLAVAEEPAIDQAARQFRNLGAAVDGVQADLSPLRRD